MAWTLPKDQAGRGLLTMALDSLSNRQRNTKPPSSSSGKTSSQSGTNQERRSKNGGYTSGDAGKCVLRLRPLRVFFALRVSQNIGCLFGCKRQRCLTAQLLPLHALTTFSSACSIPTRTRSGHGFRAHKSANERAVSVTRQQPALKPFHSRARRP